jgi:hypothetical protein
MLDRRLTLAGTWVTVMLIYLMGDVLRIYSGDMARMADAQTPNDPKWLLAAIIMLVPISMTFLALVLPRRAGRIVNIVVAAGFMLFVLGDIGSYPSAYDKLLLAISAGFKAAVIWQAWTWPGHAPGARAVQHG